MGLVARVACALALRAGLRRVIPLAILAGVGELAVRPVALAPVVAAADLAPALVPLGVAPSAVATWRRLLLLLLLLVAEQLLLLLVALLLLLPVAVQRCASLGWRSPVAPVVVGCRVRWRSLGVVGVISSRSRP
jgi:hypothetical protein